MRGSNQEVGENVDDKGNKWSEGRTLVEQPFNERMHVDNRLEVEDINEEHP